MIELYLKLTEKTIDLKTLELGRISNMVSIYSIQFLFLILIFFLNPSFEEAHRSYKYPYLIINNLRKEYPK